MRRRPSGSLLISIALHVVLGAALVWLLSVPYPYHGWLDWRTQKETPSERLSFVTLPGSSRVETPGRSGGDGRPVTSGPPAPPLVAPSGVPSALPTPPAAQPSQAPAGGRGPVVGQGGLREGITPSFSDPRVWVPPAPATSPPRSPSERLDSALVSSLRVHQDSMAAVADAAGRKPGDWTFERNGKKWGMDSRKIYIGDHSIPTAILALLPLNSGSNPIKNKQERALNFQHNEIMEQAQRAMNEDEFREAVKRIRERKEREHEAEQKRKQLASEGRP